MRREELPPRARRILSHEFTLRAQRGTTSACAENTAHHHDWGVCPGNYLRVRGEYQPNPNHYGDPLELPPRARRIQWCAHPRVPPYGTTSACAENTACKSVASAWGRNYLRVRGEYQGLDMSSSTQGELPPRARRILVRKTQKGPHHGTTSACAENTRINDLPTIIDRNYLRVRGEYTCRNSVRPHLRELPPRARRIQVEAINLGLPDGTTSACAENTSWVLLRYTFTRNYLRVRGEYPHSCYTPTGFAELPPRARRIPGPALTAGAYGGTTSACAENTATLAATPSCVWNYLRVRGEYYSMMTMPITAWELPPRARRIHNG